MKKREFEPVTKDAKKLSVLYVTAILLVLALSLGAIVMLPFDKAVTSPLNTATNTIAGGALASNDIGTYYAFSRGIAELSSPDKVLIEGECSHLSIDGDTLYFVKDGGFMSYNIYTRQTLMIAENAATAVVLGNWVFYTDSQGGLNKCRLDGSSASSLNIKPKDAMYIALGTDIYYLGADDIIMTCRGDGTGSAVFYDKPVETFSIEGKLLLYISDRKLYTYGINSGEEAVIQCEADKFGVVAESNYIAVQNSHGIQVLNLGIDDKAASSSDAASAASQKPVVSGGSTGIEFDEDAVSEGEKVQKRIETLRADEKCEYFQADKNFIYWLNSGGELCRIKPDNTEYKTFK